MAFSSTVFVLFSLAAASTVAHGNFLSNLPGPLAQVNVVGRLLCTADGNPVAGVLDQPVTGANVTLSCNGGETNLWQALSDTGGFYEVALYTADALLFDESECEVLVQLPVGNCTLLPTTGNLRAPTTLLNVVPGALGLVGWVVVGLYEVSAGV